MDMLTIIIERDKVDGQIKGLVPHLVDHGLSISHYADDTVLILDHDIEQPKNMKLLLCIFGQLSGININIKRVRSSIWGDKTMPRSLFTII